MNSNTDREEDKVKGGGELLGQKLRRGVLVGKREGNSTPPPTWKFGIIQADGTLIQDSNFNTDNLSARKLGANLWEMEPQLNRVAKMRLGFNHHPKEKAQADEQPTSSVNLRKQVVGSMSSASCCSSMEMAPYRPPISPNSSLLFKGKSDKSSHGFKTSTELLKVLNRIWSLEEKHALDMSLVRTLRRELDQSQSRIQEMLQEKKRDQNEINNLNQRITDYKAAVESLEDKLEAEQKLRKHSEKVSHKLANEILEIKLSLSNSMQELEQERKARGLLEDLCDEFARGIKDYEQEARLLKQKSGKRGHQIKMDGHDRLILHVSEAWLDERAQMKRLADSHDVSGKQSALDKMCNEIESFLHAKGQTGKNESKHSLESLHLEGPVKDDESVSIGNRCSQFCRGMSSKQASKSRGEDVKATTARTPHASLEDEKLRHETDSFDPSTFTGPPSPVKKWTSEVPSTANLDVSKSPSRRDRSIRPNTLKAKLMEARAEGRESRRGHREVSSGDLCPQG